MSELTMLFLGVIPYPTIDPVAVELGPLVIRWYALAYIAGLVLAWWYCRWLATLPPRRLGPEAFDDFLVWATVGVILGGRLGYVLFYKPDHYLAHPAEILQIWEGGMSFHGGLLGVLIAIGLFARKRGVHYFHFSDMIGAAAPIGLGLGRVANFINGELVGRPSEVPWAMVFPGAGPEPRHPSQLYQAFLEGVVLFLVLYVVVRRGGLERTGLLSGCFMIGYGLARMVGEIFRAPDPFLGFIFLNVTMGQLLSVPMVLIGIGLVVWSRSRP